MGNKKNIQVARDFFSILSLIVSIVILTSIFFDGNADFGIVLLIVFTLPFFLIAIGKSIHFIYKLWKKKEMELWEKILVPLFLLMILVNQSPITPGNYRVSSCNPNVRMVTYLSDIEAWRGGESYVFRSDSTAEYRLSYVDMNGELKETFPYVRKGDSLFFRNDTFLIREGKLVDKHNGSMGRVCFDKD